MCTQFGGHGDSGAEEEEDVESVQGNWDDGMAGKRIVESNCCQVEQGQHAKDGHEDIVVDQRRVARESSCDHATHEGQHEKGAYELEQHDQYQVEFE